MKAKKQIKKRKTPEQITDPIMVFEHVPAPAPERPFDRIAKRVIDAITELNAALQEAHECAEMRVFIGMHKTEGEPARFDAQIYTLTNATLTYKVTVKEKESEPEMIWQHVKDPAYRDAAGHAFRAFNKVAVK